VGRMIVRLARGPFFLARESVSRKGSFVSLITPPELPLEQKGGKTHQGGEDGWRVIHIPNMKISAIKLQKSFEESWTRVVFPRVSTSRWGPSGPPSSPEYQ